MKRSKIKVLQITDGAMITLKQSDGERNVYYPVCAKHHWLPQQLWHRLIKYTPSACLTVSIHFQEPTERGNSVIR